MRPDASAQLGGASRPVDAGFEARLRVLALGIVVTFAVFGLRLFQLQIIEGEDLLRRSKRNSVRAERLAAPRGEILDREGRILASTRPAFALGVIPSELPKDQAPIFRVLAGLLEAERLELRERVGRRVGRERFQPVLLRDDLSFASLARVEALRFALPGVVTPVSPRRHYLEGPLAAHLLGTIGEIRADQLGSERFERYKSGDVVGQTGLEALLESRLRGRAGGRNVVVDVAGREIEVIDERDPYPGGTVVLTIDLDLQRAAEEAFDEPTPDGLLRMGALVALDPRNGDVLAMVSRPTYDPNDFAGGIDQETWKELMGDPWHPLQNRAFQNHYPPGSTYKPFVAAAALQEGVINADTEFFCPGHFRLGRRTYRCWKRPGHGTVNLQRALKESCDVYFYQVGLALGVDRLARYARSFGLGRPTGLPLRNESTGLIPTAEWKERRFKEPWMKGETVSISIGQGFNLTTPVQLAVGYAALANQGKVVQPRLILRHVHPKGKVEEAEEPVVRGEVQVDARYLNLVREGLRAAVEERHGTGGRARVPGVEVAGKTGTAQVVRLEYSEGMEDNEIPMKYRDHGWFVAFAPVEEAEIVVAVLAEHGGHGGSAAAPIAQRVLARYFEKTRPAPTEEEQRLADH